MKKYSLAILFLSMVVFTASAQVYPSTVGLRASVGNYGIGPELSYQHGLGDVNRAEVGLGIGLDNNFDRFGITGAFHWVVPVESGFSWYAGPAVQGWLYSFNGGGNGNLHINSNGALVSKSSALGGAVGGHVGIEYDFGEVLDLPFTASVDSRPMFNFVEYYSGFEFAVGLSIRYTF